MSGMCERSAFDTFYHLDNDDKGLVIFYGFDSSIIRYDTKERLWLLTIEHKPDIKDTQGGRPCERARSNGAPKKIKRKKKLSVHYVTLSHHLCSFLKAFTEHLRLKASTCPELDKDSFL